MAKKKEVKSIFKIQAPGGTATPAPPIGPALGAHGVNPGQFIQQFNAATAHLGGMPVGCVITVYTDRSFEFEVKSPPASVLLRKAAGAEKGSGKPNTDKVGKAVSWDDCLKIADEKGKEMSGRTREANARSVAGTARNMGIVVEGIPAKK